MAKYIPIIKEDHQTLTVTPSRELDHAKQQHLIPIVAPEYVNVATSFPIVFVYNKEMDRYRSMVLTSFIPNDNVFYGEDNWDAIYLPTTVTQYPFALGIHPSDETKLTTHIDIDSPRVNQPGGQPLFDENGQETDYFNQVQQGLGKLYEYEMMTDNFVQTLQQHKLICPMQVNLAFADGERKKVVDMYTLDEQRLAEMDEATVMDFHRKGYLAPLHALALSSLQLNRICNLFNKKHSNGIEAMQVKKGAEVDPS